MTRRQPPEPDRSPPRLNGRCRDCGALLRFASTRGRNARIALDYEPSPTGRVMLSPALYGLPIADVLTNADLEVYMAEGEPLYSVHARTCAAAEEKRRRAEESGWW